MKRDRGGVSRNGDQGAIDRPALRQAVLSDREALTRLEHILHPMVEAEERAFVARARRAGNRVRGAGYPAAVRDRRPTRRVDVVVVSAPRADPDHRVAKRRKMSEADIEAVIARQMPDAEKRRRADLVLRTGLSRYHALRALRRLIKELRA